MADQFHNLGVEDSLGNRTTVIELTELGAAALLPLSTLQGRLETNRTETADYSITAADSVVLANAPGATTITMTLPDAVKDARYTVIRIDNDGASGVTIATADAATIDGAATLVLAVNTATKHGVTLYCDGTNWWTAS
jgi:hypothetical protein